MARRMPATRGCFATLSMTTSKQDKGNSSRQNKSNSNSPTFADCGKHGAHGKSNHPTLRPRTRAAEG